MISFQRETKIEREFKEHATETLLIFSYKLVN